MDCLHGSMRTGPAAAVALPPSLCCIIFSCSAFSWRVVRRQQGQDLATRLDRRHPQLHLQFFALLQLGLDCAKIRLLVIGQGFSSRSATWISASDLMRVLSRFN